jgi:hypothetical protein
MALEAESAALLDKAQLLVVAMVLVAGFALAAVDGVVNYGNGGEFVVALVTGRFFGACRGGQEEDPGCGQGQCRCRDSPESIHVSSVSSKLSAGSPAEKAVIILYFLQTLCLIPYISDEIPRPDAWYI